MLGVVRDLNRGREIERSATFMGAHEIPVELRGRRCGYVDLLTTEMIPAVSREGLAEWCDVFCETGVFTADESREILAAARRAGLKLRIHADEFGASGGSQVAPELEGRSADHLIFSHDAVALPFASASLC